MAGERWGERWVAVWERVRNSPAGEQARAASLSTGRSEDPPRVEGGRGEGEGTREALEREDMAEPAEEESSL